jgi:Sec-independent protein secretion pathway component TatC
VARLRPVNFDDRLSLVEHLDELRTRVVVCISAFAVAFTLCFWQNGRLLDIANAPLPGDRVPITLGVAEPFMTTVTIAVYAAIVISLPVILYQAYAYALPALTDRERRMVVPFLVMVPVLLCAGSSSAISSSCQPPSNSYWASTRVISTSRSGRRTTTASSPRRSGRWG